MTRLNKIKTFNFILARKEASNQVTWLNPRIIVSYYDYNVLVVDRTQCVIIIVVFLHLKITLSR